MSIRYLLLVILFCLSGCAGQTLKDSAWSADLPAQDHFLIAYQQDTVNSSRQNLDDYLTWVMRFYQGNDICPNGWNHITADIVQRVKDPEQAYILQDKMAGLGLRIAGEWAKDNQARSINSRHVSIWGNALIKSIAQGETLQLIDRVSADVDDLLGKRISADVITEDRFYAEEDIFSNIN